MGATVTVGKAACAFKAADGNIYFALYEEVYEKNCYPHTPHWESVLVGTIEQALRWIFLAASSCESGMLQGRGGNLTPGGYVDGWLKVLADPCEMPDRRIDLFLGKTIYGSDPIPFESSDRALKILAESGFEAESSRLALGEKISITLYQNAALVAALYGGVLGSWRILGRGHNGCVFNARNAALGYHPQSDASQVFTAPLFLKVDENFRLVQQEDGAWRCMGREYSVIGSFIAGLWKAQLSNPGCYKKRIKIFRDAITNANALPKGTRIAVDLTVPLENYQREHAEHITSEFDVVGTDVGYILDIPSDPTLLYRVCQLSSKCAQWLVPSAASAPGTIMAEQLSLLAA